MSMVNKIINDRPSGSKIYVLALVDSRISLSCLAYDGTPQCVSF